MDWGHLIERFIKGAIRQKPFVLLASAIGGIGIVNIIDALMEYQLGREWEFVPGWARQLFDLIRGYWRPLFDVVGQYLPFEVSEPAKDYFLMGVIVAGMRWRSSAVIWNALKANVLVAYPQQVFWTKRSFELTKESKAWEYYLIFLPIRLVPAFFVWPVRIAGAATRYLRGDWEKGFKGKKARKVREEQYTTFFASAVWAIFFIFLLLIFR